MGVQGRVCLGLQDWRFSVAGDAQTLLHPSSFVNLRRNLEEWEELEGWKI